MELLAIPGWLYAGFFIIMYLAIYAMMAVALLYVVYRIGFCAWRKITRKEAFGNCLAPPCNPG